MTQRGTKDTAQGQFKIGVVEGHSHPLDLLEEAAAGRKGRFLVVEGLLVRTPAPVPLIANVPAGDWPQDLPLCPRAKGCTPGALLALPQGLRKGQAAESKCYPPW